ncbi:MAG TPA: hypothetical protein VK203_14425 [Nostocaceae cyanobacterium]|nr:hypothetical protein [Nostocaceae cyanobacterium]
MKYKFKTLIINLITAPIVDFSGTSQTVIFQTPLKQLQVAEPTGALTQYEKSVGEAAKLTPAQIKQLLSLDRNNSKNMRVKIIVPTYIPSGFRVNSLETRDVPGFGPDYIIAYHNPNNNSCFYIRGGFEMPIGDEPTELNTIKIYSPALGSVLLLSTEFNRLNQENFIRFEPLQIVKGQNSYSFESPSNVEEARCNAVRYPLAIKIVESLQYLN